MSTDTLSKIYTLLYEYIQFDTYDKDYPTSLSDEDKPTPPRTRITVNKWNRDATFRKGVLENFNYRCAVCRCNNTELLEAAHIQAVSDGGNDDISNGICLCANHHKMFDKGLIKINIQDKTLPFIEESVQKMAWYNEYVEKYKSVLYIPDEA